MKRTFKNKLMLLLLALVSLFILGGCTLKPSMEDTLDKYDLVAQVTYYSNGGAFDKDVLEKNYYFAEGQKAPPIGSGDFTVTSGVTPQVTRAGYDLVGWYHVECDADGKPVFEDEKNQIYKLTDEEVDFDQPMEKGTHWVIAAKWAEQHRVHVYMACEEGKTVEVDEFKGDFTSEKTSFVNGDKIGELYSDGNGEVSFSTVNPFTVKDNAFTFIRYYMDAECTIPTESSVALEDSDMTVYAKYATGDWTRVSRKSDFIKIFTKNDAGAAGNYWIMEDIDCGGSTIGANLKSFSGKIEGEGHKVSNFTLNQVVNTMKVALFGDIKAGASIRNITFENVKMVYTSKSEWKPEVYGVFTSIDQDATIVEVKLTGSLSFSGPNSYATNMKDEYGAEGRYDHCLFGGFEKDNLYTGDIRVTLTIDGKSVSNISE